jgi:hypothetical protein
MVAALCASRELTIAFLSGAVDVLGDNAPGLLMC